MVDNPSMSKEIKQESCSHLGEDFLTWLWFRSEKDNSVFVNEIGEEFYITFEDKIVVAGGEGEFKERTISSGKNSSFKEARFGLRSGKKVVQAKLKIEYGGEEWMFQVKAEDFSFSLFKTPKLSKESMDSEDPEALFFEKLFLIDKALSFFDSLFFKFLTLRNDAIWYEEREEIKKWIFDSEI